MLSKKSGAVASGEQEKPCLREPRALEIQPKMTSFCVERNFF